MLSVRPRELCLVLQHHEAAMMMISCSSFRFVFLKHSPTQVLFLKFLNTNIKCKNLKLGFAVRQSKLESFWMFKGQ